MEIPAARLVFNDEDRATILTMIDESLQSGSLTLGAHTRELEDEFRTRHDSEFAVAVSSGTSALEIVLRSLGIEGREVVVPTNTFFATAAAVLHAGGTPRFADVSADTLALSVETLEAALTDDTVGAVLVHIGGAISPDTAAIAELCAQRGIFLFEDAAHAHGASYGGKMAGTFGVAGAFSFYPTKVITSGEGGMIVTGDERIRDDAVIYRDQGKAGFLGGDHVRLGYAWRMSELHAAVGLVQLRRLDEFVANRRAVAAQYDDTLAAVDGITPLALDADSRSNYYKYIALLDQGIDRQHLKDLLRKEHGVAMSGEVYAAPLHFQPVFDGLQQGGLPVSEDVCARHVCLPIHSDMTAEEATYVVDSIAAVLGQLRPRAGS